MATTDYTNQYVMSSEFLSRLSHEIRTPMNAIIGLDEIALQEKDISVAMEDHLKKIGDSAHFLLSLIDDILDFSRIQNGKMTLKPESFVFEDFINNLNNIMFEQCRNHNIDYDCVLKNKTEETYLGDETRLQQALIHILSNSVNFTKSGGKIHFIIEQLSLDTEKARLQFTISDTGIGIDPSYLPHVFEPFNQENKNDYSEGTGLGLAIANNIVTLMNGKISVTSQKNVGSTFVVEVELSRSKEATRKHDFMFSSRINPLLTLIVDDDNIVCQHTKLLLEKEGLKTETAQSGKIAIETIKKNHAIHKDFDLILIDWKMPDMDGIETTRQIRQVIGSTPVIIMMSACDYEDLAVLGHKAGVDMFMKKPLFASSISTAYENIYLTKKNINSTEYSTYDFSGKHILVTEDNDLNKEIVKNLLTLKNATVDTASNGVEALEAFTTAAVGYYDAILMDIRMPVMNGLDATKTIRELKKADSKTIPIIAMTANSFQEDINKSLNSGMNAHLIKPIDPEILYQTLNHYFTD